MKNDGIYRNNKHKDCFTMRPIKDDTAVLSIANKSKSRMYFPARLLFLTAFIVTVNVVNSARAVAATEPLIEQITTLVNQDAKKG